jgi:hypothetical protein
MSRSNRARTLAAIHHAGHAVVATVLDVPFSGARLTTTDRNHLEGLNNRHVIDRLDDFSAAWPFARRATIMALAGHVAEQVMRPPRPTEPATPTGDTLAAYATVQVFAKDFAATMLEIISATFEVTRKNWTCIEHIADELLARRRLTASEVAQIIKGAIVPVEQVFTEGGSNGN